MRYENYLAGKKVLIVGGAPGYDPKIEHDYDVVIKTNNHIMEQGGRADIIYHSGEPFIHELLKSKIFRDTTRFIWFDEAGRTEHFRHVAHAHGIQARTFDTTRKVDKHMFVKHGWLQPIMNRYNFKPLTGIVALLGVLRHDIKSVFVTGMTLYYNPHTGSFPRERGPHDLHACAKCLIEQETYDKRVKLDDSLISAIRDTQITNLFFGEGKKDENV